MDEHLIVIFQTEIELQCRFVLYGAAELERLKEAEAGKQAEVDIARNKVQHPFGPYDEATWSRYERQAAEARRALQRLRDFDVPGRTWFAVQGVLTAAANLSKLLWGSGDKPGAQASRAPLRSSVGVTNDSPLRSPKVRNHFEHIDERIERKFTALGPTLYVGRNMGRTTTRGRTAWRKSTLVSGTRSQAR